MSVNNTRDDIVVITQTHTTTVVRKFAVRVPEGASYELDQTMAKLVVGNPRLLQAFLANGQAAEIHKDTSDETEVERWAQVYWKDDKTEMLDSMEPGEVAALGAAWPDVTEGYVPLKERQAMAADAYLLDKATPSPEGAELGEDPMGAHYGRNE